MFIQLNLFSIQEQLQGKHVYVDGRKIEETGFTYERPKIDRQLLKEVSCISGKLSMDFMKQKQNVNWEGLRSKKIICIYVIKVQVYFQRSL